MAAPPPLPGGPCTRHVLETGLANDLVGRERQKFRLVGIPSVSQLCLQPGMEFCPLHLYHLRSAHAAHGGGALFFRPPPPELQAQKQSAPAMGGMG